MSPRATDLMRPPPLPLDRSTCVAPLAQVKSPRKPKNNMERGRQSFSCAECRRLKLKCSRVWPCASCEKRGCAQICPKGEMVTGKGKRLILADTEELHNRITLLEVALAQAQSLVSSSPHPLLESTYLFSSREAVEKKSDDDAALTADEEDNLAGGPGTLTITSEGRARFVGSFAGSEYLRQESQDRKPPSGLATPPPSTTLGSFDPDDVERAGVPSAQNDVERLRAQLPVWETEGAALVDTYYENVNWMYQILPRVVFFGDHLTVAYDPHVIVNPHKIACVFLVMALGCMFDLDREPYDPRGNQLFRLGRACLDTVGMDHACPATIQAIDLCGTYLLNGPDPNGAETFWPMLGTAVKVAQSLGLHRDGNTFGLSPNEVEERRQVWWEIITYDRLQSMCFGRPCTTSNKSSDTQFPEHTGGLFNDTDGYHRIKYRLVEMMEMVIDIQTQTTPVSISKVKHIDDQFREFKNAIPDVLLPQIPILQLPLDPSVHPHLVIHRLGVRLLIAQSRLLLNRPLFAAALAENPGDPSHCKYGDSFFAAYESAQEIVQLVKQLVIYHPSLIARWWFFWFHAFSASVCLAAITIRAPTCAFASRAFHGMTTVCDIATVSRTGCRARRGLPILLRLRKRASDALLAAGKAMPTDSEDDDLSHLSLSAKLCRMDTPTSPRRVAPVAHLLTSPIPGNTSPQSPRSVATSVTLAEPVHYDAFGSLVPLSTYDGVVQPPPPVLTPITPGTSAYLNLSPLEHSNTGRLPSSFTYAWPPTSGLSPSSIPDSSPQNHTVHPDKSFSELKMVYEVSENQGGDNMGVDVTCAELAFEPGSQVGADEPFDFDMFVNQMGAGELGLSTTWTQ